MAEITQNIVQCPICGNYYDSNHYLSCPYCAEATAHQTGAASTSRAGSFPATEAPSGAAPVAYPQTAAPAGAISAASAGGFPHTEAPSAQVASFPATEAPRAQAGSFPATVDPTLAGGHHVTEPPSKVADSQGSRFPHTAIVGGGDSQTPSPVVGWLVGLTGSVRGTDFRLHAGYNFIGRETGDIRIGSDPTVSAERDTSLMYTPKTNKFYIAHEQGKNVLMVNDEPVFGGGRELADYDIVTVGNTQLVFIGLCGGDFRWGEGDE